MKLAKSVQQGTALAVYIEAKLIYVAPGGKALQRVKGITSQTLSK